MTLASNFAFTFAARRFYFGGRGGPVKARSPKTR